MASAEDIPPGGEGKIHVSYKTGSKFGKKSQTITVDTNDPENRTVKLKVVMDIQTKLAVEPERLYFGRLTKGSQSPERFAVLVGNDKASSKITSLRIKNEFIKGEIISSPSGDEKEEQKVKLSILSGMKVGRFNDWIMIYTDHKEKKSLKLLVSGEIVGNISVLPQNLSFGIFRKGGNYDKIVRLKAAPGMVFKVLDVKSTVPDLIPSIQTVKEGSEYLVKTTLKESFDKAILNGQLIISTDDKEQESIVVNVSGKAVEQKPFGSWSNETQGD